MEGQAIMANSEKDDKEAKSHKLIEENLKRVYDETLNEDIPDRFKDLLARLKASHPDTGQDR
jgi:hypothetical protein